MRRAVRRALVRHAVLTAVVTVVLSGITVGGLWLFADGEAHRTARDVSGRVATAVVVSLAAHHYDPVDPPSRDDVLAGLAPFIDSGMLARVKIWRVVGDQVQVVVSDEPRIEGERRRFDADLARRLDAGEIVVLEVPDNPEHRYERADGRALLEAFVGFRDAWGVPMRLEVYVPVDTAATVRSAMADLLPLVIGSLLVLAAATVPITVSLARRVERDQRERQAVLHYGLAASERERRRLAQVLHDGVVQDLAGTGLLLDALLLDETADARRELLGRAHRLRVRDRERQTVRGEPDTDAEESAADGLVVACQGSDCRRDALIEPAPQHVRLRREVVEEAGPAHAGARGDVGDRGVLVPLFEKELAGGIRDGLAG